MREYELRHPQAVLYEVVEALTPHKRNEEANRRNIAGGEILQTVYSFIQNPKDVDLPKELFDGLKQYTKQDLSEIVAQAIQNAKSLYQLSDKDKLELLDLALTHDIQELKRQVDGKSIPIKSDIFPRPPKPEVRLAIRERMRRELAMANQQQIDTPRNATASRQSASTQHRLHTAL